MARLGPNRYGKSRVRLVKVERQTDRHLLRDVTVDIALEGEFELAHSAGDNQAVLPTDTMKNTVYALARERFADSPESYALTLARHFLDLTNDQKAPLTAHVTRARIRIAENLWSRIVHKGKPHPHAFQSAGREQRIARVIAGRDRAIVYGGIHNMLVLKTGGSGFADFLHDRFTTLPDTDDRIFATAIRAEWRYHDGAGDHTSAWQSARTAILETFAAHESKSVQHTLYAMGEAVLAASTSIEEVHFVLPNRHHLLIDVTRFGLAHENDIFVATTEPYGRIEATVRR